MKNLKKHLTLSALFVAGTILSGTAFAEDSISTAAELAAIITAEGERTGTLTNDITAEEALGNLSGTTLTINGNNFGISGEKDEITNLAGLNIAQSVSFILNNLSSIANFSSTNGGAINNRGNLSITDTSFLNNAATGKGGAIYNRTSTLGTLSIIASTKDVSFSGNTKNNISNDIYNTGSIINLYSAAEKTLSFGGGIEGFGSTVNINVKGTTSYDVTGTVLFKTDSITSGNHFNFGAGTLKLERAVSQNWTNNSLEQTGGTLNLQNNATESTNFVNFNSSGGTVDIDIDFAAGTSDQINVTGTLSKAAEIGNINFLTPNVSNSTQSIAIGNGLHLTGTRDIVTTTTLATNYTKVWLTQSETISNSLDVGRLQSINSAISDSSATTREISLVQNVSATANLGTLAGTQLTINGNNFGISGNYGTDSHYSGITVNSLQTLIMNNVGSVDTNGNVVNSWSGFNNNSGGAIYNNAETLKITNSVFSNNSATTYGGGAISCTGALEITNSEFSNNSTSGSSGGAIINSGMGNIIDSTFSNNFAAKTRDSLPRGGAIYNSDGTINIIAKDNNSVFSGNYVQLDTRKYKNDIYNNKTINIYAASGQTVSFDGGIMGSTDYSSLTSSVNINVNDSTDYDVAGTVLFKSGSINSRNKFTLGAGTLKLESGVTWTNNSLTQTGGTLDLANGTIETTTFGTLNSTGGGIILDINFNAGTSDQITATTSTSAIELSSLKNIGSLEVATKTIVVGNGVKISTPLIAIAGTTENNYHQMAATQSAVANSIDVVYEQSLSAAIKDDSAGDHLITFTKDTTASADLGSLKGTKLTIDANNFKLSGNNKAGITVAAGKTLVAKNVNEWSEFSGAGYGSIAYNLGTTTIEDSTISSNTSATLGGAISNENVLNIAAVSTNTTFSGNKAGSSSVANDIHSFNGTTNIYAAARKTVSFDGGIAGEELSTVNVNVQGTTSYDVTGTVLFKTGSINSGNNFELGAGTLKLESGVTWTNNTLAMNGGALDIGSSTGSNIGTLNYEGGSLTLNAGAKINIDISESGNDKIVFSNNAQFILNGGKLSVNLTSDAALGEVFEIMTDFVWSGTFDANCVEVLNAPEGWNTNRYFIASMEGTGSTNSLLLTVAAIPEPSMFGLFAGLAGLTLAGTRRRRK